MYVVGFPSKGESGGLALLWDKSTSLTILSYSSNHIDANVQLMDSSHLWRFTDFMGNQK